MHEKPPCAGVLVFRTRDGEAEIVLVQARSGKWGFPKGKRERGESVEQNAFRELAEETGLSADQLSVIRGASIDEASVKGHLAVRYFIARLIDSRAQLHTPADEAQVVWKNVDDARKLLPKHRRVTLDRACRVLGVL